MTALPTPVFVISFNRRGHLERSLASYRQLGPIDVVIHDNGSDDPDVLAYLDELEQSGAYVRRNGKVATADDLDSVADTVAWYFAEREPADYVVTDPDIELLPGAERTLAVHRRLLLDNPDVEAVGPMLRIDDVPPSFPLRTTVLNWHIHQFWRHAPELAEVDGEPVALQRCPIDTTFATHRAGAPFRRLSTAIRLYGRYSARHLDWYPETAAPDHYARTSNPAISHWGNERFHAEHADDRLVYTSYLDVDDTPVGQVVTRCDVR
jgi:hypothetical protein